jgi:hypothetical protein
MLEAGGTGRRRMGTSRPSGVPPPSDRPRASVRCGLCGIFRVGHGGARREGRVGLERVSGLVNVAAARGDLSLRAQNLRECPDTGCTAAAHRRSTEIYSPMTRPMDQPPKNSIPARVCHQRRAR